MTPTSPAASRPRKNFLFTCPRTASNLLIQILNLAAQPSLLAGAKFEYFFTPTLIRKIQLGVIGKHIDQVPESARQELRECYDACVARLNAQADAAISQGKDVFVKEHIGWLIDPVFETEFLVSTAKGNGPGRGLFTEKPPGPRNKTVLSDAFLRSWRPTFLIRHPALMFPSLYRTSVDNEGAEHARNDPMHPLEMTLHWTRSLYEWFGSEQNSRGNDLQDPDSTPHRDINYNEATPSPIILDADDIILQPALVTYYAQLVGLSASQLRFIWPAVSAEEIQRMHTIERRMRSTISASTGVLADKAVRPEGVDISVEREKWALEFGEVEAEKIAAWVAGAVDDYLFLRERRLKVPI
jgi:hypothetical protein